MKLKALGSGGKRGDGVVIFDKRVLARVEAFTSYLHAKRKYDG